MIEYEGWYTIDTDSSLRSASRRANGLENYQTEELFTALKYVTNFGCAIDVGAHVGLMSYHLSQKFEEVHAFEIFTPIYECLVWNLNQRDIHNVTTYNFGVGAATQKVDLNTGNKTFSTHVKPNSEGQFSIMPLDDLGLTDVGFIKIDAEGYEPFVIQGALNTIKKYKPVILYERKAHATRYGYSRDSVFHILQDLGYWFPERPWPKNGILVHEPEHAWKRRGSVQT